MTYSEHVSKKFPCPSGFEELNDPKPGDIVFDRLILIQGKFAPPREVVSYKNGAIEYRLNKNATCTTNGVWYVKKSK